MINLLKPPVFDDEDKTLTAHQQFFIIWSLMACCVMTLPIAAAIPQTLTRWLLFIGYVETSGLVLLVLNRYGYIRLVGNLIIVSVWLAATGMAFTSGGTASNAMGIYFIVVLIAGFLLSWRAGLATAVLCSLSGLVMVYLGSIDAMPAVQAPHTPLTEWIANTTYMAIMLSLQYLVINRLREALQKSRDDLKERQRIATALQERELRYRTFINGSPSIVFLKDENFRNIVVNRPFAQFFSKTEEELIGKTDFDLFPQTFAERFRKSDEAVVAGTSVMVSEISMDGQVYEIHKFPVDLGLGRIGVGGYARNITYRKKAEAELRESEERFLLISRNAKVVIWMMDMDLNFTYLSPYIKDIIGYTPEEYMEKPLKEMVTPASFEIIHRLMADALEEEIVKGQSKHLPKKVEVEIIRKDGTTVWSEFNLTFIRDDDGKATGILGIASDITERRKIEEQLQESEKFFRSVVAYSHAGIHVSDENLSFTYLNDRLCEISGYSREELLGTDFRRLIAPESLPFIMDTHQRRNRGEDVPSWYEFVGLNKKGERIPIEASTTLIKLADGHVRIVGQILDITDRKQAEDALRESESKFRDLAEKSMVGIYLVQDGLYRYVNAEFARIFGYTVEEIMQHMIVKDMIYPEDWPLVEERLRQRQSGELLSLRYDFRVLTKENGIRHVEVLSSRTFYQGKPAVIGTILDITDRLKAEEDLRRLSIAIEQATEDVVITDTEGIIQYVNPAFERITGYSRRDVIGKSTWILKSGLHDPAFYEELIKTVRNGNMWKGRVINRGKDGKLIHEDTTITPLVNSTGKLTGYVSLKRDVTQEIKIEEHLRQSQKMEAIGTLAGGIAHDFNNILSAIMGYAELSKMLTSDEKIEPYLDQILQAGLRSRDLVQQILTFSRKREQEKKPVLVKPIVKEALKLLRSSIPATVEIRQKYSQADDAVLADPTQIHQIVMNLCTNAVHAMRDQEGILDVSVGPQKLSTHGAYNIGLKEGSYLKLAVRDNGVGITSAIKDKIFDPFFTTKKQGEGTGLGLSVVYGIVKDHDGTVTMDSEEGVGTVFTVYLPLIALDGKPKESNAGSVPHGTGRILFVEDEEPIASMAEDFLKSIGYDVIVYLGGHEALEAFLEDPDRFDLVVTDMTMPNMTGANLAREVLKVRPNLPVILTTGYSELIDEEEARKMGIREFFMKPVALPEMANAIKRHIKSPNSG